MTNIQNSVWKRIDADPSLQLDLQRGIINVRALARQLRKTGLDASEHALISAIRRYPHENPVRKIYEKAGDIVAHSSLSAKSHIASLALVKGAETQSILPKLFGLVHYERGETLRIVQGEESIRLLIDGKNVEKMLDLIPARLVLKVQRGMAEINMHLHPAAVKTPGIMYVLCGQLSRHNINIYEITSCVPEMLIFVDEDDLPNAYKILFELCHPKGTRRPPT